MQELIKGVPDFRTPYYLYRKDILKRTLDAIAQATEKDNNFIIHYAIKANDNPDVLKFISSYNLGADCVSGGEIEKAVNNGFNPAKIVFAGVGKRDEEIEIAIKNGIYSLNVESIQEIEVINEIASRMNTVAPVAIRVNPNVDAHTHEKITTGTEENKFGIALEDVLTTVKAIHEMKGLEFRGLQFHIGSQITEYTCFENLCKVINKLTNKLESHGIKCEMIDVGGGLGIDYDNPKANPIPDFNGYFNTFRNCLKVSKDTKIHFELGRSVVAQCGNLITKVLYTKQTAHKQFVIVDAGFTDLVRPALYGAYHDIENLSNQDVAKEKYDIVGPICESSDVFAKDRPLSPTKRGDILSIHSAGAYGEVMASTYNARPLIKGYLL